MKDWQTKALAYRKQGLSSRNICEKLGWSKTRKSTINDFFSRHDLAQQAVDLLLDSRQKILYIDIEKTFAFSGHFQQWQVNLSQEAKLKESYLLSYSYAWDNEDIHGEVLKAENIRGDLLRSIMQNDVTTDIDFDIVLKIWHLLDQANVVVAHNGRGYDIKEINAAFLKYNLPLPSPYKVIDTLAIAKKMFRLPFKSLKYLAQYLNVTQKISNDGNKFWKLASIGYSNEVLEEMLEYNKGDIQTLREVYLKLRGYSNDGVNLATFNDSSELACPNCGNHNVSKLNKLATTTRYQYDAYRCGDCGAISRATNLHGEAKALTTVSK